MAALQVGRHGGHGHGWLLSNGIADQRTGHAVAATAALAELGAVDGQDLDAVLAHERVGVLVALVGDDDAGLERHDVVAVVPLLALGLPLVAAGADDPEVGRGRGRP